MKEAFLKCSICGNPITAPMRTTATGEPIHAECVVKKLVETFREQRDPSSKRAS